MKIPKIKFEVWAGIFMFLFVGVLFVVLIQSDFNYKALVAKHESEIATLQDLGFAVKPAEMNSPIITEKLSSFNELIDKANELEATTIYDIDKGDLRGSFIVIDFDTGIGYAYTTQE